MCGLIGIVSRSAPISQAIHDGLTVLQHRGQDAAGMVTDQDNHFYIHKDTGLVRDVFDTSDMMRLAGTAGIGHVRYPTRGGFGVEEAQPLYVNSPYGIALAHNGQLVNSSALRSELHQSGYRHLNTGSDSEVLINVLAEELQHQPLDRSPSEKVLKAVSCVHKRCHGGYAAVALIAGYGMVAFRDPDGIRPLVYGRRKVRGRWEYVFASESVAIDMLDYEFVRDVYAGEVIFISDDGVMHSNYKEPPDTVPHTCLFEYVYLARPDSIIDGLSVYQARLRMGEALGKRILRDWKDHDIDVVIPVPDTGRTVALPLARSIGVDYREGFVKNRYSLRSFIMPGQVVRQRTVRQKLNTIDQEFTGKNVLLVDDSLVRGTTAQEIVQMARAAGARRVYLASAAPPVRFPNYYGIDIPDAGDLIANGRDEEEVGKLIGADRLIYQRLDDMVEAILCDSSVKREFDASCFNGVYVSGYPPEANPLAGSGSA